MRKSKSQYVDLSNNLEKLGKINKDKYNKIRSLDVNNQKKSDKYVYIYIYYNFF